MRVVFVGTGQIGVPTLRALQQSRRELAAVITQPDKPAGRSQHIKASPVKMAMADSTIPIFQPQRIKEASAIEKIRSYRPDVIVVVAYGQILPADLLALPRYACLNVHASLLPRWRGAAPIQAAIAAGDTKTGLTIMFMDEGLDTGDILSQQAIPISDADTGATIHDRLAQIAPQNLLHALDRLEKGNAPRVPQDSGQATYAPKLTRESGRINWSDQAEVIGRRIRAFDPWPGTFTQVIIPTAGSRTLKIFSAAVVDFSGKPGEIVANNQELIIAAGKGGLSLKEVQLEGRRRMAIGEFLRGLRGESSAMALATSAEEIDQRHRK
jgi:methionyl-tRNA formyltransferase